MGSRPPAGLGLLQVLTTTIILIVMEGIDVEAIHHPLFSLQYKLTLKLPYSGTPSTVNLNSANP
jgi:hypothetical protein